MTYTYKCNNCGEIQIDKSINEPEIKQCPECGREIMRIFTPTTSIWNTSGACGKVG